MNDVSEVNWKAAPICSFITGNYRACIVGYRFKAVWIVTQTQANFRNKFNLKYFKNSRNYGMFSVTDVKEIYYLQQQKCNFE